MAPSSAATVARRQRGGATVMSASPLTSLVRPDVLGASARAVAELFSCCLLGVMASKLGILGPVNVNALSKVGKRDNDLGSQRDREEKGGRRYSQRQTQ